MVKKIKITLGILGLLVTGVVGFIVVGLYGMEIEDTYGGNQDIYYGSRQGDIVVNHQTKEFGIVEKTWKRFYVVNRTDTLDVGGWWDDKNIEIYKLTDSETWESNPNYRDLERLKDEGKLKLKRKLR